MRSKRAHIGTRFFVDTPAELRGTHLGELCDDRRGGVAVVRSPLHQLDRSERVRFTWNGVCVACLNVAKKLGERLDGAEVTRAIGGRR